MSHSQGWKRSTQTRGRGAGDSSQQVLVSEVSEGGQVCARVRVRVRTHLAASATRTVAERTVAGRTAAPAAPSSRRSTSSSLPQSLGSPKHPHYPP